MSSFHGDIDTRRKQRKGPCCASRGASRAQACILCSLLPLRRPYNQWPHLRVWAQNFNFALFWVPAAGLICEGFLDQGLSPLASNPSLSIFFLPLTSICLSNLQSHPQGLGTLSLLPQQNSSPLYHTTTLPSRARRMSQDFPVFQCKVKIHQPLV